MTTELPYTLLGRKVRPVSLALAVTMLVLLVVNTFNVGEGVLDGVPERVVGAASAVALVALIGGWVMRSNAMNELGLLLAAGVWTVRAVFIALTAGFGFYGVYLNLAWVIVASGAFLLERADDGRLPGRKR